MVTVDDDQSTNDTVICLANGLARNPEIKSGSGDFRKFAGSLKDACTGLAKMMAKDGEGAKKFIEVRVENAWNKKDARRAAKRIAGSNLVKTAIAGSWPNWGRVLAAAGSVCARMDFNDVKLDMGPYTVYDSGPVKYDEQSLVKYLEGNEISIRLDLKKGTGSATAWGCDMTEDYVRINMEKE